MAKRSVEGLIMKRAWEGENNCLGCKATEKEISDDMGWQVQKVNTEPKFKDSELLARRPKTNTGSKESQTLLVLLLVLTVKGIALVTKHRKIVEERKVMKRKKEHWEEDTNEYPEEQQLQRNHMKRGVG